MNEVDFLNHVKDTLDKLCGPWRFVTTPYKRGPYHGDYFFIEVLLINTNRHMKIRHDQDGWSAGVFVDGATYYDPWLANLLRGYKRNDAGESVDAEGNVVTL